MSIEKILYTAHATTTGGREGSSKTDDGKFTWKYGCNVGHIQLFARAGISNETKSSGRASCR